MFRIRLTAGEQAVGEHRDSFHLQCFRRGLQPICSTCTGGKTNPFSGEVFSNAAADAAAATGDDGFSPFNPRSMHGLLSPAYLSGRLRT